MPPKDPTIIVIGAGVIGLSTATLLQSSYPTCRVIVVAAELPTTCSPTADYASLWAGAHYRPCPGTTPQIKVEAELAVRTATRMRSIARESPEAGVGTMLGKEYLDNPPEENLVLRTGDVYAWPGDGFRVLDQAELPAGVRWGCEYETYSVHVPLYCTWLLEGFNARGGRLVQRKLGSAEEAFEISSEATVVVNCSGRNFDRDPKVKIVRGQTVLVRQEYHSTITRQTKDGSWAFLIPRPQGGGTIIGGTKEVGDWEPAAKPETRLQLLRQSVESFPDFVDAVEKFDVVRDNVGRRPWREGGLRMEIEGGKRGKKIVHGYGAGGRGYELSWGVAERLVGLVTTCFSQSPSKAHL